MTDEEDDDLDESKVSIGLLMEVAQTHQQLAEATLASLKEHTTGLDAVVREQIRQTLIDQLRGVHIESQMAVESIQRIRNAADRRTVWWSVWIAVLSAVVASMVGYGMAHAWR